MKFIEKQTFSQNVHLQSWGSKRVQLEKDLILNMLKNKYGKMEALILINTRSNLLKIKNFHRITILNPETEHN